MNCPLYKIKRTNLHRENYNEINTFLNYIIIKSMKKYLVLITIAFLYSCQPKTVEKDGGLIINIILDKNATADNISSTIQILKNRIERFCVDNPSVTLSKNKKEIQIMLPLATDSILYKDIVKKGNFEITETYDNQDIYQQLANINNTLNKKPKLNVLKHIDSMNVCQSDTKNQFFKILHPAILQDGHLIKGPIIGLSQYQDTALINSILYDKDFRSLFPSNIAFKWSKFKNKDYMSLIAVKRTTNVPTILSGMIKETSVFEGQKGSFNVTFALKPEYYQLWSDITKNNIGKCVAIIIDNEVFAYPKISSEIKNGASQISCDMTIEQAKALATILKSGATPLNFKIKKIVMTKVS